MLLIFRLNKATGTQATFTIPNNLEFQKLIFKGYSLEFPDRAAVDGAGNIPTNGGKTFYLQMDCFGDADIMFFQGRNNTITGSAIGNMIPLGNYLATKMDYQKMDFTVISHPQTWENGKTIEITINQIEANTVRQLTNAQLFGVDEDADAGGANAIDHGLNLYFELEPTVSLQETEISVDIADST